MEEKENAQAELKEENITREFVGYGKFTVRGIKAGESLDIQSKAMTVNPNTKSVDVDAKAVQIGELKACIIESPKGDNPDKNYLENLPKGIVEVLAGDIKSLSTPESVIVKN